MIRNPLFEMLERRANAKPDDVFFEFYNLNGHHKALSFGHMRKRVASTAQLYIDHGLSRLDIVLIFAQHSEGMLLAFFGAQWMGAIPAFMPPPTIKQDIGAWASSHKQLIERIRPSLVICEPSCLDHVKALGVDAVLSTDALETYQAGACPDAMPVDLDQIAFLQHSSGTTGLKKGVMVTYSQLLSQLDVYGDSIGLDETSNVVSWLPIYHDMGLIAATLLPVRRGAQVRLIDTFVWLSNPGILMSLLAEHRNCYCWLPNFAFNYIAKRTRLELSGNALSGVKAVINCSEPCKKNDIEAFHARFSAHGLADDAIQVCYAAAEYVFAMTQTQRGVAIEGLTVDSIILETENRVEIATGSTERTKVVLPVGLPIAGAELRIGDDFRDGTVGEVSIRGPSLCSGYFRNDEMTNNKFIQGWYKTGDLGFRLNGILYITGRMDDLIIVRGKNIYAHDVEAIATAVPGVKEGRTSAFGIDDQTGTQQLILAVETTGDVAPRALKMMISDQINASFGIVPADIVVVNSNSLVKTTSGKISRSDNRKNYLSKTLDIAPSH